MPNNLSRYFLITCLVGHIFNVSPESTKNKSESDSTRKRVFNEECETKLKIKNLCAHNIATKCLESDQIKNSGNICTENLDASANVCANGVSANEICGINVKAVNFCATGTTSFNHLEVCQPFRATAVFGSDQVYTLGTPLNFDTITDNPNGNMTLAPTEYNVPVSGYYIITLQVDQHDISGAEPILGTPVASPKILVNGVVFRESFVPYLSFHNTQRSTFSVLLSLTAGDKVTSTYDVLVQSDGGFTPYAGTVTIDGNGFEENKSVFKIHYLSSTDCPLAPCTPCTVTCPNPCDLDCTPPCPC